MTRYLIALWILLGSIAWAQYVPTIPATAISGGGSAAAFDATAHGSTSAAGTSITSFNITLGSLTDGMVKVDLGFSSNAVSAVSVTVGGSSATLVSGTDSTTSSAYRGMTYCIPVGTTSGAKAVVVSWTGTSSGAATASSWQHVNQSTPCSHGTFAFCASACTGTSAVTITSATNDAASDGLTAESGATPTAPTQTSVAAFRSGDFQIGMGVSRAAGAASVGFQWTTSSGWVETGVDIVHD